MKEIEIIQKAFDMACKNGTYTGKEAQTVQTEIDRLTDKVTSLEAIVERLKKPENIAVKEPKVLEGKPKDLKTK